MPIVVRLWAFWACVLGLLVLALGPPITMDPAPGGDKTDHVLAFSVLAVLGCSAYLQRTRRVIAALFGYGIAIELAQMLLPHRFGDASDILANCIGLALGGAVFALVRRMWPSALV